MQGGSLLLAGLREQEAAIWLMQEFSPLDRRISLEGVGLLHFRPAVPDNWTPPPFMLAKPWSLNSEYGFAYGLGIESVKWKVNTANV